MKNKKKQPGNRKRGKAATGWSSAKSVGLFDPNAAAKTAKVRITSYLDSDVLTFLKKQAAFHGEGYQTLMNGILRDHMKQARNKNHDIPAAQAPYLEFIERELSQLRARLLQAVDIFSAQVPASGINSDTPLTESLDLPGSQSPASTTYATSESSNNVISYDAYKERSRGN